MGLMVPVVADHVETVSLAHEVMLLVVGVWFWCSPDARKLIG